MFAFMYFFQLLPSIKPQRDSFPVQHSGHFHNMDMQSSSVVYQQTIHFGNWQQPCALALPPTSIWGLQAGVAPPDTCWETSLGCGRKAGGTTRINNSASVRNPRVHSVQSRPEIRIWEPPNQHQPANCSMFTVWGTVLWLLAILWHCCDQDALSTHTQPPKHVFLL